MFRIAKQIKPEILTVMGGPNIPLEPDRRGRYLDQHSEVDVYALGEGDFLASAILETYLDAGMCAKRFGLKGLDSIVYRNPEGQVVVNPTKPRHREVEEIPSP